MRNSLVIAFLFTILSTLQANAQAIVLPCVPMGNSCVPVSAANPLPTTGTAGAISIDASGGTSVTNGTNNAILYQNGSGNVAALGNFIYSAGNNNLFLGPSAGNVTVTGTDDTAFGIGAGAALTVPAMAANPQAVTLFGFQAGAALTSARETTCIGYLACTSFTGSGLGVEDGLLTCIGSLACTSAISPAENVVAIGQKACAGLTTGTSVVCVGTHSGLNFNTQSSIIALGKSAGDNGVGVVSTIGNDNILIGDFAASFIGGTAANNIYIGDAAGQGASAAAPNTSSGNVVVGHGSGIAMSSGTQEVFMGYQACAGVTTSSSNICIGYQAALSLATGTGGNVIIGSSAGATITTGKGDILLGGQAGKNLPSNAANFFVAGSDASGGQAAITNVFFGTGYQSTAPLAYTINGSGGSGTDSAGADIQIGGGKGTGAGVGGKVHIQTALHSTTGTTLNTLADALVVDETKLVTLPAIASDAALTDTTVCQDTTNHGLRAGSGTAGICLGNVSSIRFKEAWMPLDDGLSVIMALNPGTWRYKSGVADGGARLQVGFLAEEYVRVLPDWTRYDDQDRPNGVDLLAVLPQAVRAIQQLKADNDNLRADFEHLRRSVVR